MPIRQRFKTVAVAPAIPVITAEMRANDKRGVFDPAKNAYEGSYLDKVGVPEENALSLARFAAFHETEPVTPKNSRVQDLLAHLRMANNPLDNIERTYRNRIRSPLTAIRAWCVQCSGGSPRAATECDKVECPLWAFHRGKNSLRKRT